MWCRRAETASSSGPGSGRDDGKAAQTLQRQCLQPGDWLQTPWSPSARVDVKSLPCLGAAWASGAKEKHSPGRGGHPSVNPSSACHRLSHFHHQQPCPSSICKVGGKPRPCSTVEGIRANLLTTSGPWPSVHPLSIEVWGWRAGGVDVGGSGRPGNSSTGAPALLCSALYSCVTLGG